MDGGISKSWVWSRLKNPMIVRRLRSWAGSRQVWPRGCQRYGTHGQDCTLA